jgi:outer membrane protein, heavy metal efflux system
LPAPRATAIVRRVAIVSAFVAGAVLPSAASAQPVVPALTLADALRRAEEAPALRAVRLEIERARADVRGAGLWTNPEASFSRETALGTVDIFASLALPVPVSGRLGLEKSAAERALRAAETRAGQDRLEARAHVREQFLELVAAQERLAVLEDGLARIDELVRALRTREEVGESSGYDRRRAERERAEVEADAGDARARLARARATLAGSLAVTAEGLRADGTLAASGTLPTVDEVRARAGARPDVQALVTAAEGQDLLAKAAGRRFIPEPVLTGGWKRTEDSGLSGDGYVVGAAIALPLFDRGQGVRAVAEAEAALLRNQREALAREATTGADAARAEAEARRGAESAYDAAPSADELARIARTAYEEGETKILDLLDAYRTALAVRLRAIDLHLEARKAEIELDRATGVENLP